jgi:Lon protease-like protein
MDLPLFPLHAVLCPGVVLPLHVFEPRYRTMVQRCLADDTPFGVVLIRDGREVGPSVPAIAGVGTVAEIREANAYEDGRYDLLTVGTSRFAIEAVAEGPEPYLVGSVQPLPDAVDDLDRARALAERLSVRFVDYLRLLRPAEGEDATGMDVQVEVEVREVDGDGADGTDAAGADAVAGPPGATREPVIPDDPTALSYLLSGIIQVELPRRQALLEADTTEARLTALGRLLDRELPLLARRLRVWSADPRMLAIRRN